MTRENAATRKIEPAVTANERQSAAADPLRSVWVGASAGTGKTKVLIDRVLRLMLPRAGQAEAGATRPDKILCLTFTKTAAAEMSNRIYEKLGDWAVMPDAELEEELFKLVGQRPDEALVRAARRLFARVLDTPGGLKIMTIHSFCQSVLKRFPVEAGLPPHFELMDEEDAVEYLRRCLNDIIAVARKEPAQPLAQAFSSLVLLLNSADMNSLMAKIMAKRNHLARILKSHGDSEGKAEKTIAGVYAHLGLAPDDTEEKIRRNAGHLPQEEEAALRHALAALLEGSANDQKAAACLQPWLERPADRAFLYGQYRGAFFTTTGDLRKRFSTKKAQEAYPDIEDVMRREAERLEKVEDSLRAVRLAALNGALLTLGSEMVGRYEKYKRQTDRLDYDDLILKTCDLLAEKDMVNWVLFKLDEGIDHILVDEAQDTSPYQWRVIKALSDEFFSGRGRSEDSARTLFVVGDEKQSIFSFQGADPAEFSRMQRYFGDRVAQVQEGWDVFLEHSFRSTRAVLEVVDAVFSDPAARQGVVSDVARGVRHLAFREGQAGRVELWPLIRPPAPEPQDAWKMPLEVEPGENAASKLARKIAETVRGWLDGGEMLESRGRPVRAGDILILVQSRRGLVEMLMRALKEKHVPVAGIDRMTLTEEIAVMDLLALAGFALQPRDDLTLATLLKSPLVGMEEEELFGLCHARKGTLYDAVKAQRPDIYAYLEKWIRKAGHDTPYEFFAEALGTPCIADAVSGRRGFHARLGGDIQDALDEFLNSALHYEQSHTPSLQKFADWFLRGKTEIKREQEQHDLDQVRIMTVHASKGLQAPIVFLPDAAKRPHDFNHARVRLIWPPETEEDKKGVPLWSPRAEFDAAAYAEPRDAARAGQEEEYRRLLYVALTRAEDRLYICGHQSGRSVPAGCWHELLESAFPKGAETMPFIVDGQAVTDDDDKPFMVRAHSCPQEKPPEDRAAAAKEAAPARKPLPSWVFEPAPEEPAPAVPLAPSKPGEDEPAARGPLAQDEDWRFRRGIIVHQILEVLPQLPQAKWDGALAAYLARPALAMTGEQQEMLGREILAVLRHPDFAPIFGAGSRAEVPVVGLLGAKAGADRKLSHVLSGEMDRLLVTDEEILIVDYKTNRPPPQRPEDVPVLYLKQLAAYKSVMRHIYPDRPVRCALLWTDGPDLMPLPDGMLEKYLL